MLLLMLFGVVILDGSSSRISVVALLFVILSAAKNPRILLMLFLPTYCLRHPSLILLSAELLIAVVSLQVANANRPFLHYRPPQPSVIPTGP
jgi:hypothetical protein